MSTPGYRLILGDFFRIKFDKNPRNFLHRHTFYEPSYVMAGSGSFHHGGVHYRLKKGDLFLANPGIFHEISSLRSKNLDLYFTSFSIQECERTGPLTAADQLLGRFLLSHQQQVTIHPNFGKWIARFLPLYEKTSEMNLEALFEALPEKIVLFMLEQLTPTSGQTVALKEENRRCERAMQLIDANLTEKISLASIALKAGLSERHLRRMFRQSQGISPIDYIQQRRVEKAAALLARPELSVKEVADRVGIWNLSQFNHLFKKIMKKSPTDFRKNTAPARKRPLETIGTVVMRTEVAHSNRYRPKLKRIAIGKNAASS